MDLQVVVAWPRPTTVMNGAFVWAEMDTSEMAPFIYIQLQSGRGHVCNPMVRAGKVSLPSWPVYTRAQSISSVEIISKSYHRERPLYQSETQRTRLVTREETVYVLNSMRVD